MVDCNTPAHLLWHSTLHSLLLLLLFIGCIIGILWVLISITVTITTNTIPSTVTGKNLYQSYTVLYGNHTTVRCCIRTVVLTVPADKFYILHQKVYYLSQSPCRYKPLPLITSSLPSIPTANSTSTEEHTDFRLTVIKSGWMVCRG